MENIKLKTSHYSHLKTVEYSCLCSLGESQEGNIHRPQDVTEALRGTWKAVAKARLLGVV